MQISMGLSLPDHVRTAVAGIVRRVPGAADALDLVPERQLRLPLIGLGNLTRPDADRLCEALADPVAELAVEARIGLHGVWALEHERDPTVGLRLVGDVDATAGLARALPPMVTDHGFFVDRRQYAPRLVLARVTPATTLPVLEAVVDALEAYDGPRWEVASVDVLQRVHHDGGAGFEVLRSLPTVGVAAV